MAGCSCSRAKKPRSRAGLGYLNPGASCKSKESKMRKVCVKRGPCLKTKSKWVPYCESFGTQGRKRKAR